MNAHVRSILLRDCVAWRTSYPAKTIRREKNKEYSIPSPGLEYAVCLSKSLVDLHGIITLHYYTYGLEVSHKKRLTPTPKFLRNI